MESNELLMYINLGLSVVAIVIACMAMMAAMKKTPEGKQNKLRCPNCKSYDVSLLQPNGSKVFCVKCRTLFDRAVPATQDVSFAPQETFICKYCKKVFDTKQKLQRHIGMAHYSEIDA